MMFKRKCQTPEFLERKSMKWRQVRNMKALNSREYGMN